MQLATTLTMASVGASMVGAGRSSRRMSRVPWIVVTRMVLNRAMGLVTLGTATGQTVRP